MKHPKIATAVPKRRYRFGEFTIIFLDEVVSSESVECKFVAAVIQDGDQEPCLYITNEASAAEEKMNGSYIIRVISEQGAQFINQSDRWANLEEFANYVLDGISKMLNLCDEQPVRIV